MSLKLFRSTGYHSILTPGEARLALHPGWAVTIVAGWVGLASNVWFWQALATGGQDALPAAGSALALSGAAGSALSLFGWRRTFKLAATGVLLFGALLAGGVLTQDIPARQLADPALRLSTLLPTWASLFRWQVPTLLVLLGGIPVIYLWNVQLRRLAGSEQFRTNLAGLVTWALVFACGFAVLYATA
ncbi:hypothetical protein PE066_18240 [Ramlibacter tataouinensis]|uniref:hypothetical protein n=1 Tax=Ramlibacter tataouinensis TaxID=94132 RepID=UPI0022F3FB3F|nr:hypothetical protein [Ramlibacter tataouinensis]WBY01381.1 hypothetical protein PE066_18240 [Ramlibacter tataouinensis]